MSFLLLANDPTPSQARRAFLGQTGLLLSGAAVALLAGRDALAAKGDASVESDVRILNTALGAELEAIAAYQVGAESGLLQKPVLDLATTFQGHHKEHADLLRRRSNSSAASPWPRGPDTRSPRRR
jgi:Ferritin-like domain